MKRIKLDLENTLKTLEKPKFTKTIKEGLNVEYGIVFPKAIADQLFQDLEDNVEYYEGELTKVKVFGKWHQIPRQQVAYGDDGMKYHFSGITLPAKPWTQLLLNIKNVIENHTGYTYNFVLINRYRNGNDYIGFHRDDEAELDKNTPIASVSLGQARDFILKHRDTIKNKNKSEMSNVQINLEHGSLLLMNSPTNEFWYHSLPVRKKLNGIRINLTFRKINMKTRTD